MTCGGEASWSAKLVPSELVHNHFYFWDRRWGWSAGRHRGSRCQGAELLLVKEVLVWLGAALKGGEGGHGGTLNVRLVDSCPAADWCAHDPLLALGILLDRSQSTLSGG